jgi:DNA invertase Pin-like site-specific DNA recombinase
MNVIGYVRVSTDDQAESGAGLAAQRSAIQAEANLRGWTVEWVEDAGYSARSLRRPGVERALLALRRGEAGALVVAKLDRLSRSVVDAGNLMHLSKRQGWHLVALDLGVDTSTPTGRLVANVMASVAEWEREIIGQRTREGLAARRASGVRLGRARMASPEVVARIVSARAAGQSFPRIAAALDADAVPTPNGGARWYPSTVARIYAAEQRKAVA